MTTSQIQESPLGSKFSTPKNSKNYFLRGVADLSEGIKDWRIWHLIGTGDLRRRFSRSRLGQFWLTLSTAFTIMIMAFVWSILFKASLKDMLPHLAVSIIVWQFISGIVTDATTLFTSNSHMLLGQRLVCSTVVYSCIYRNFLTFLFNLLIIPFLFIIFKINISLQILLVIPALILIIATAVWVTYLIAALSARFRDFGMMTNSIMQLAFYITPVIWKPGFIAGHEWIIWINPFAYYLSIIRSPILGEPFLWLEWITAVIITVMGLFISIFFIGMFRRRLLFWL